MLRNRSLLIQLVASLAAVAVASAMALPTGGIEAAGTVAVLGFVLAALFLTVSALRIRALARLSRRIEEALEGRRTVSFADMSEGELAILTSVVGKTIAQLSIANEDLGRERDALADALADISHQIRTPLTSLVLELELARTRAPTPELRERLRKSESSLEQIQWLVSSLLKLARLDSGSVELSRQNVSVASLVAAAFDPLAVPFDLKGVSFASIVEPSVAFEGDPSWTREALTNILKNCLEHTPRGGSVRVTASEDTLACRIRIEDTGPGIADEDLPHIFERFYRGRTEQNEAEPQGFGIGLSLARALIRGQGGQICASNARSPQGDITGARFDIAFFKVLV